MSKGGHAHAAARGKRSSDRTDVAKHMVTVHQATKPNPKSVNKIIMTASAFNQETSETS